MIASKLTNESGGRWRVLLPSGLLACALLGHLPAHADELPELDKLVASSGDQLAALSSETDAGRLYQTLAPRLNLSPPDSGRQVAEPTATQTELVTALALWRLADTMRQASHLQDQSSLRPVQQQTERQSWLLRQPGTEDLQRAARLLEALAARPRSEAQADQSAFQDYAGMMDRTYPHLSAGPQSWVDLAETEGAAGLHKRLTSLEQTSGSSTAMGASAAQYFDLRLRPVLTAQLAARAIRARGAAEERVRQSWRRLHDSAEQLRHRKALARLCGTWQWTIHNHRHHQEQKLILSFPPPEVLESPDGTGSRPAKVVVLGDVVYLRWESQGAVQEDSLLFTNQGLRLEGSFTNSAGSWGSITGKRTAPCQQNHK